MAGGSRTACSITPRLTRTSAARRFPWYIAPCVVPVAVVTWCPFRRSFHPQTSLEHFILAMPPPLPSKCVVSGAVSGRCRAADCLLLLAGRAGPVASNVWGRHAVGTRYNEAHTWCSKSLGNVVCVCVCCQGLITPVSQRKPWWRSSYSGWKGSHAMTSGVESSCREYVFDDVRTALPAVYPNRALVVAERAAGVGLVSPVRRPHQPAARAFGWQPRLAAQRVHA